MFTSSKVALIDQFFFFQRLAALPADFPSQAVWEAYLCPSVDSSEETFEWGRPELDSLRRYVFTWHYSSQFEFSWFCSLTNQLCGDITYNKAAIGQSAGLADFILTRDLQSTVCREVCSSTLLH